MTWRLGPCPCALAFLLHCFLLIETRPHAAMRVEPKPTVKIVDLERGGILPLAGGSALLWNNNGQIQVRSADGRWAPRIDSRIVILQIAADASGALLQFVRYAGLKTLDEGAMLLGLDGKPTVRWGIDAISGVGSEGGKRWATIGARQLARSTDGDPTLDVEHQPLPLVDTLLELGEGGSSKDLGRVELGAQVLAMAAGRGRGVQIACTPAYLTDTAAHEAYCTASGPAGWRKPGQWDVLPFICGATLIEVLAGEFPKPKRPGALPPQVIVRRLSDGSVAAQRAIPTGPAVACGGPGELLIGRNDVQGWSLPDLQARWRTRAGRGRVTALARVGDEVLVATSTGDFKALKKPVADSERTDRPYP